MTILPEALRCPRAQQSHFRTQRHDHNSRSASTLHGAQVGDLFMAFIRTAELCDVNSLDYLTELQRHAAELANRPVEWMPWNYRETLARIGA
jgi:transposase